MGYNNKYFHQANADISQEVYLQCRKPHLLVIERTHLQLHEHINKGQKAHPHPASQVATFRVTIPRHPPTHRNPHLYITIQRISYRQVCQLDQQGQ